MTSESSDRAAHLLAQIEAGIAEQDADPELQKVVAELDRFDAEVKDVVAQFPPEEADQARAGIYRDAEENVRTRHRQLRSL